ncbi:MAG: DMT family transporter [Campylobacteraceae bacterium]|nr:DMT family transporter [Campylobacteraceae bacterium]
MSLKKVYISLVLCVLFWSGNFIIGKYLNTNVEAVELAFFRWFFVLLFIFPTLFFVNVKKIIRVTKENIFIMSALALLGITLFNTIVYSALKSTSATNALLINSTTPLMILFFSYVFYKTKILKIQVLGIIISTFGVAFLILKGNILNILDLESHSGDLYILLSSLCWTFYSLLLKFKPKEFRFYEFFVSLVILGFIFLLPIYLYQGYSLQEELKQIQNYWYFFLYISFFTSILSYFFWNIGIDEIGAAKTGQFTHLMPLFGSFLAYIFLGESLSFYHIIGALLIAAGIYLSLFVKK